MPSSRVLSFADPFAYQSAFRSVDVELFPTVKGEFRAELTQVSLSKLWVHGAHEDLPRVYIGIVKPHRAAIGFLTRPNQPAMQHCGMAVSPGDIIIVATFAPMDEVRARRHVPTVIHVDEQNRPRELGLANAG